jgi:hypothetical protein
VLDQWKEDIERVRDSLKRLQEERIGLKRPESMERFHQQQQEVKSDTIKPYIALSTSQPRDQSIPLTY